MATIKSTIEFIQSHGHFATETVEGVLATSWEGGNDWHIAEEDDQYCEAPMVFPIVDGNVSSRAVRDWLGY